MNETKRANWEMEFVWVEWKQMEWSKRGMSGMNEARLSPSGDWARSLVCFAFLFCCGLWAAAAANAPQQRRRAKRQNKLNNSHIFLNEMESIQADQPLLICEVDWNWIGWNGNTIRFAGEWRYIITLNLYLFTVAVNTWIRYILYVRWVKCILRFVSHRGALFFIIYS